MTVSTPFKQPRCSAAMALAEDRDTSMAGMRLFEMEGEDSAMGSLASPPRRLRPEDNIPSANLFECLDDKDAKGPQVASTRKRQPGRSKTRQHSHSSDDSGLSDLSGDESSVLRPLDMNLSPSSLRRKRPSNPYPAGKEEIMEESDEEMFLSPGISPRYRTIDGRTVTSKNPFSPYPPTVMVDAASSAPMHSAPSFPVTFEQGGSFDANDAEVNASTNTMAAPKVPPRHFKINLQQRGNHQATTPVRPQCFPSRDGYPDRHGRYSFTGSPIEELDMFEHDEVPSMGSKIRRLNLSDHASRATEERRIVNLPLFVDCDEANHSAYPYKAKVSPVDVMSFPTPTKAARQPTRYTPLKTAPPQTPMIERRNVARRPLGSGSDMDEDHDDTVESSSGKPKSRFNEDFDVIGQLGTGSFGTVYKCLSRLDGCMYAVKAAKRKAKGVADRDRMLQEVYALAALSDQADTAAFHIVRYHQAWMEENRLYIQTELCATTLQAEMALGRMNPQRQYKLLREILLALEFLHRNGMVHLDIKPENIFVKNDQFKLGDFGLVSKTKNGGDVEEGDSRYMSMELLSGEHDDLTKSDIFSLGATMYELCLGRPLPTDGEEWQRIRSGALQPLHDTPLELELIIKQMMNPDPHNRPTASELLKRRQLLSEEQKQLMAEKSKVYRANMALEMQMKKLNPTARPGSLIRANTWNGSGSY